MTHSQGYYCQTKSPVRKISAVKMRSVRNISTVRTGLEKDMAVPRSEIDYYLDNEGLDHLIRKKNE